MCACAKRVKTNAPVYKRAYSYILYITYVPVDSLSFFRYGVQYVLYTYDGTISGMKPNVLQVSPSAQERASSVALSRHRCESLKWRKKHSVSKTSSSDVSQQQRGLPGYHLKSLWSTSGPARRRVKYTPNVPLSLQRDIWQSPYSKRDSIRKSKEGKNSNVRKDTTMQRMYVPSKRLESKPKRSPSGRRPRADQKASLFPTNHLEDSRLLRCRQSSSAVPLTADSRAGLIEVVAPWTRRNLGS